MSMLEAENTVVAVIDVQGKLAGLVHGHERVVSRIRGLLHAAGAFGLPVIWSEQAPDKIGETVAPLKDLLAPMVQPVPKRSFSCWQCPQYVERLHSINRRQIVVTGIETHVCVYQTCRDLHRHGYDVHLIADAVSSRHEFDHQTAIARLRQEGITISSTEMAVCELLGGADHSKFREIMAFLKG